VLAAVPIGFKNTSDQQVVLDELEYGTGRHWGSHITDGGLLEATVYRFRLGPRPS
jgi:hypothetical protein